MQPSGFSRHALTMLAGAALAQLIPLAVSPLLARLYTPEQFGVLATVLALSGALATLCTGRYELAVILPEKDSEGLALAGFTGALAVAVCSLAAVAGAIVAPWLPAASSVRALGHWLLAVPLIALIMAFGQIGNYIANRNQAFRTIATASVGQQIVAAVTALALGGGAPGLVNGLVVGRVAGLLAFAAAFRRWHVATAAGFGSTWSTAEALAGARTYHRFPTFNLPYSMTFTVARDILVFAFNAIHDLAAAGLFGMARTVVSAPFTLLSASLSQVYYREAARTAGTPALARQTWHLLVMTAMAFVPGYVLLGWWATDLFAFVFGERWRQAGLFAAALVPPAILSVATSWPDRIFDVRLKQHWALAIQVVFELLTMAVVWVLLARGATPLAAVIAYAGVQCLYHACFLAVVFHLVSLSARSYTGFLALLVGLVAAVWAAGSAIVAVAGSGVGAFVLHAAVVAAVSAAGLVPVIRTMMSSSEPRQ